MARTKKKKEMKFLLIFFYEQKKTNNAAWSSYFYMNFTRMVPSRKSYIKRSFPVYFLSYPIACEWSGIYPEDFSELNNHSDEFIENYVMYDFKIVLI